MDSWLLALAIKPLVLLALFVAVYLVARLLFRIIPNGSIKRLLYDRTLQKRHPWKFGLGFLFGGWLVLGLAIYLAS